MRRVQLSQLNDDGSRWHHLGATLATRRILPDGLAQRTFAREQELDGVELQLSEANGIMLIVGSKGMRPSRVAARKACTRLLTWSLS